ncbi:hypothetical protein EDB89DRAFT_1904909 [Lactarius sanguifluus]|nr:hypothetical protein EDB89DRAFT_1904909 [Lactarius sanguifluus]
MHYHRVFLLSVLAAIPHATPHSPRWGEIGSKHSWSNSPSLLLHARTLELVHPWLEYCGVLSSSVSVKNGGSTLKLTGVSVSPANILGASYRFYGHVKTNETIVRTIGYALPAMLHDHVQTVAPITSFDPPRTQWQIPRKRYGGAAAVPANASGKLATEPKSRAVNASTLMPRQLHGYTYTQPLQRTGTVIELSEPTGPNSVHAQNIAPTQWTDPTFTVVLVDNGGRTSTCNTSYPTQHIFYRTGRGPPGKEDWYLSWLGFILRETIVPQTISISYGNYEKPGLRGVPASSSSQAGTAASAQGTAKTALETYASPPLPRNLSLGHYHWRNDELQSRGGGGHLWRRLHGLLFAPVLLGAGRVHLSPEPVSGLYNPSGRGIPDISAQAVDFRLFLSGTEYESFGTSGSAPPTVNRACQCIDEEIVGQAACGRLFPSHFEFTSVYPIPWSNELVFAIVRTIVTVPDGI